MYTMNKARTGIFELDIALDRYLNYLAEWQVLPEGTYCFAGGCLRCVFDNTRLSDLDIYILGDINQHNKVKRALVDKYYITPMLLENPFTAISLINLPHHEISPHPPAHLKDEIVPERSDFKPNIQIMSYTYDDNFASRTPKTTLAGLHLANKAASTTSEILSSFDLTLSNAAVEFEVGSNHVAISSVDISTQFLVDICMRKLVLAIPNRDVPQQLTSIRRFHKFVELGYKPDKKFFDEWDARLKNNPHVLELNYDNL